MIIKVWSQLIKLLHVAKSSAHFIGLISYYNWEYNTVSYYYKIFYYPYVT